jgi:hypothetical protein
MRPIAQERRPVRVGRTWLARKTRREVRNSIMAVAVRSPSVEVAQMLQD